MKYIISESRFENLILNYLNDSLENIKHHSDVIDGDEYEWWAIGDVPVFALREKFNGKLGIAFEEQYVSTITDLFGISEEDAKSYILKWINSKLDIHPNFIIKQSLF